MPHLGCNPGTARSHILEVTQDLVLSIEQESHPELEEGMNVVFFYSKKHALGIYADPRIPTEILKWRYRMTRPPPLQINVLSSILR